MMNKAETFAWMQMRANADRSIPQSRDVKYDHVSAYLRTGHYHYAEEARHLAVGIARVDVKESLQGKGHFKAFIIGLEEEGRKLGYKFIRVEQPCQYVIDMIEKHGYVQHGVFNDVWAKPL